MSQGVTGEGGSKLVQNGMTFFMDGPNCKGTIQFRVAR